MLVSRHSAKKLGNSAGKVANDTMPTISATHMAAINQRDDMARTYPIPTGAAIAGDRSMPRAGRRNVSIELDFIDILSGRVDAANIFQGEVWPILRPTLGSEAPYHSR